MIDIERRERQRHRQREKQAPRQEPDTGLNPRTPGSRSGPKAGAKPLSHPGIPPALSNKRHISLRDSVSIKWDIEWENTPETTKHSTGRIIIHFGQMMKQGPESKQLSQIPRPFRELRLHVQAAQGIWLQSQALAFSGSATISLA